MRTYQILAAAFIAVFSVSAWSYPDNWENFNANSLHGARDATIGNTQEMLRERGSFECIVCHGETDDHYEGVIDTTEIVSETMGAAMSCLDWQLTGICIWLKCAGPICTLDTSLKVKNFVPDLVVQSYDRANGEPWTESQDINQISQGDADSSWVTRIISLIEDFDVDSVGVRGGVSTEGKRDHHANLHFKLVDAYGNPAILAFNAFAKGMFGLVCDGKSLPFYPYYVSNLDSIAWRWDVPEMFYPQSWAGFNIYDLGSWSNNYGPIYPRHGFMTAQDPLKAAVLSAFRAAHFITRPGEPHLYFSIYQSKRDGYWPPDPLTENDKESGQWQMLYPRSEGSCRSFPYGGNPSTSRRSTDGSYVWNFWRSYECCERKGQRLLFH